MSSARVLSLAQQALHTPNGGEKALRYLEEEVRTSHEIGSDAGVWACIAHLRRKQGDLEGGDEAETMARQLADANVQPRKLSFDEDGDAGNGVKIQETRKHQGDGGGVGDRSLRCRDLLQELGVVGGGKLLRVDRLLERTRRLRKVSEGLLDDSIRGNVEGG